MIQGTKVTEEQKIAPAFLKTAKSYQTWNTITAECYNNKMKCSICCNREECSIEAIHQNPYKIANIKYAVLMTYANIGDHGIDLYLTKLDKN